MIEALVSTENLGKRYGQAWAVRGLTFRVEPGEIVGLLGPNGAGKTTTVKLLLHLVLADEGGLSVLGRPAEDPASREGLGYSPEQPSVPRHLTLRGFLRYQSRLARGAPCPRSEEEALAEQVGLSDALDRHLGAYSKGMLQRAVLASALLAGPRLLLLDEPTSGLDPIGRRDVRLLLSTLKRRGTGILLNSHLLSEVERSCDRVLVLRAGRIVAEGPPEKLARQGCRVELTVRRLTDGLRADLARLSLSLTEEAGVIVLELPGEAVIPEVAELVARHGCGLLSLSPRKDSLEDVFHRLMEEPQEGSS